MSRRHLVRFTSAAVLAVALLAAACGGAPASHPTTPPTSPPAAAPASHPASAPASPPAAAPASKTPSSAAPSSAGPVKVGLLVPQSGTYAILGTMIRRGYDLYMSQVGSRGGGRTIQTIVGDTQMNPNAGVQAARKVVEVDHVSIVTGVVDSGVAAAMAPTIIGAKKVFLISNACDDTLTGPHTSPYLVRASFSCYENAYPLGSWLYNQDHIHSVVVVAADYAAGYQFARDFASAFEKAGGKVTGAVWVPLNTVNFGSYLARVKSMHPQAVWSFFAGADALHYLQAYKTYGLAGKIPLVGTGDMVDDILLQAIGPSATGATVDFWYTPSLKNQANTAFVKAWEAKYHHRPNTFAVEGYDTAQMIVKALDATHGDASAGALGQALLKVHIQSPRGPVRWDPVTHDPIENYYIFRVVNNKGRMEHKLLATIPSVSDAGLQVRSEAKPSF